MDTIETLKCPYCLKTPHVFKAGVMLGAHCESPQCGNEPYISAFTCGEMIAKWNEYVISFANTQPIDPCMYKCEISYLVRTVNNMQMHEINCVHQCVTGHITQASAVRSWNSMMKSYKNVVSPGVAKRRVYTGTTVPGNSKPPPQPRLESSGCTSFNCDMQTSRLEWARDLTRKPLALFIDDMSEPP